MNPNEPDSAPKPQLETTPKRKFRLLAGIAIGAVVVIGGGLGYARYFVYQKLSPQVETQLTDLINRPINLGEVNAFSLSGIRLGYSELPATPEHPNRAVIESVIVNYNLWSLLTKQELKLDLTLVRPKISLEQDENNVWLDLDIDEPDDDDDGGISVEVSTVQLRNADVVLRGRAESGTLKEAIAINIPYGKGDIVEEGKAIDFDVKGEIKRGGKLEVKGKANFVTGDVGLDLRTKKMQMSTITDLLPLPFTIVDGEVDGALEINLNGPDVISWNGEVIAVGATISLPQLAKPIVEANSRITFDGLQLTLNELSGRLGEIGLAGNLNLDIGRESIEGKFLADSTEIGGILRTFDMQEPEILLEGKLRALVSLTGALENPQLFINAINDQPLTVDRISIEQFQGTLAVVGTQFIIENFIAEPTLGGQFQGQGVIQLPTENDTAGSIAIAAKGQQLPTDALARLYEIPVPVELGLGTADLLVNGPVDQPDNFVVSGTAVVPVASGLVTATDLNITLDRWETPAQARGLRLAELSTQTLPIFLQNSLINGEFLASGALQPEGGSPLNVTGSARTAFAGGQAIIEGINVEDNLWRADVALRGLDVNDLAPDLPNPVIAKYAGDFVAAGTLDNPSLDAVEVVGSGRLTLASGTIRTENVRVAGGQWYSRTELDNADLVSFSPQLGQYVDRAPANGTVEVRGTVDNPSLDSILAQGSAIAQIAGGTVNAGSITLRNGQFTSNVVARGVNLRPFSDQLTGTAGAEMNVAVDLLRPSFAYMQAQGDLYLSQGVSIIDSPLQSRLAWDGKQLQIQNAVASGFRANGVVDIDGDRLTTDPIGAITNLALNLDVDNFELTSLPLPENVQALNLQGQGGFLGTVKGTPTKPVVNGQLQLDNLQMTALAFDSRLEGLVQTRGDRRLLVSLEGEEDKILARLNPNLRPEQASLKVNDAEVNVAIDYINGGLDPKQIRFSSTDLPVALVHALAKDQDFVQQIDFPIATIQVGGTLSSEITGDLQTLTASGRLAVDEPQIGYIAGDRLNGDFYFGNNTLMVREMQWRQNGGIYTLDSTVNLPENSTEQPRISLAGNVEDGRIEDILLALQIFDYSDFQNLTNISLPNYLGRSNLFDNTADLYKTPPLPSPVITEEVVSLELPSEPIKFEPNTDNQAKFNCEKLLKENSIQTSNEALFSRDGDNLSFPEKIALVSCLQYQLAQIDENIAEASLLPAQIADLKGAFNGDVSLNFDGKENLEAEFDFRGGYQQNTELGETVTTGQAWQWGEIEIPFVVAKGVFRNNVLTLRPINIQLPDGRVSLIASLGGETQTAQLRLTEIPVAFVKKFVDLPDSIGVSGLINANANLAGTPEDPSARGDMQMVDTRVNGADISDVKGNFTYEKARLNFVVDSELVAEADPIRVTGSLPYQLPNATVAPDTNDLNLTFDLKDEGFILLNILSDGQLAWLEGEGNVDLTVNGTINPETRRPQDLVANGQAAIANAKIQAKTLPDAPIENIEGQIDFNLDNLEVKKLTGNFSGGNVDVSGILPILQASDAEEQFLKVKLNDLDFELPNLYRGGVGGELLIAGTALEPEIGGDILLEEGRVILVDNQNIAAAPAQGAKANTKNTKQNKQQSPPPKTAGVDLTSLTKFNDLKITLGRNIQITRNPILNFLATGEMLLNGTLAEPKPDGVITLKRGQVNLFATQLRLDNGYRNTATFDPRFGLDPMLDVVLRTSLIESSRSAAATTNPLSAEIQDTSNVFSAGQIGTIETIRVEAKVQGRASKLNESIELTSSPPRSETALIALMGGTLIDSFSDDSTGSLALANLAGSALLNSIQDSVGSALGLSELRLFPTIITDEENRDSTLGLGAEVSIDVTSNFSLSALQILNSNEATQFGIRYRVNDEIFLRGSTNLNDDSRLTIEYDLKF
ncbi:MAG: DUF748 domain-containing protein [Limnothrix sp. RL_2_0]|nr:DUF748 domain-containing protein [Limnothrix sp. RL_2_0]